MCLVNIHSLFVWCLVYVKNKYTMPSFVNIELFTLGKMIFNSDLRR